MGVAAGCLTYYITFCLEHATWNVQVQFDFSRCYDILDAQVLRSLCFPYLCERGETSGADLMAIVGDGDALLPRFYCVPADTWSRRYGQVFCLVIAERYDNVW